MRTRVYARKNQNSESVYTATLDKTTTTYELVPRDAKFDYTGFWIVGVKRFETEVKAVVVLWTVPTGSRVAASGRQHKQRADEAFGAATRSWPQRARGGRGLCLVGHSATLFQRKQAHFGRFCGIMFSEGSASDGEGRRNADLY